MHRVDPAAVPPLERMVGAVRHHVFVTESRAARRATSRRETSIAAAHLRGWRARLLAGGREIAFVSKRDGKDRDVDTNHDVWTVSRLRRRGEEVDDVEPAADMTPVYSPDGGGRRPAQRRAGFEADRWYLDAYDRARRTQANAVHDARSVGGRFRFSPDGETIWFTAVRDGAGNLYRCRPPGARRSWPSRAERSARSNRPTDSRSSRNRHSSRRRSLSSGWSDGHDAAAHHENAGWLAAVELAEAREPDRGRRGRHAGAVLAPPAAGLRRSEEVSGGLPHPRRSAGRPGRTPGRRAGIRRSGPRRAGSWRRPTRGARPGSGRSSSTRSPGLVRQGR